MDGGLQVLVSEEHELELVPVAGSPGAELEATRSKWLSQSRCVHTPQRSLTVFCNPGTREEGRRLVWFNCNVRNLGREVFWGLF